jgi:hypothetical protein
MLRLRGCDGHITAGGAFATLARAWLLARYGWLDSVVRFAGERPLVELTAALRRGGAAGEVGGVTTRDGDGAPAPVTDPLPLRLRPRRERLPEVLGHPAAHVAATRGCPGRCAYCGPAAWQAQEREEGFRAGIAPAELNRVGVGGTRRRPVEDLCDEMAELWHGHGVRYFYFVDEQILPPDEEASIEMLAAWRRGLRRRDVGRFGIGLMIRADRIPDAAARAFVELGLVRAFVGVELASRDDLRRYGRTSGVLEGRLAVERLESLGVAAVANLLLLHPYATVEGVAAGIEFLAGFRAGIFEATRMMVYHGTRLHERLLAEGRLTGNPLRYDYAFEDPALERFAAIFARLRGEAFEDYSLAYRAHDTALAVALARRLHPDRDLGDLRGRLASTAASLNALRAQSLREGLALAVAGGGFEECEPLLARTRALAAPHRRTLDDVERALERRLRRPARVYSPLRTAAASAVGFCLAACGPRPAPPDGPATTPGTVAGTSARVADAAARMDPSGAEPEAPAARPDAGAATSGDAAPAAPSAVEDGGGESGGAAEPEPGDAAAAERRVREIVAGLGIRPEECLSIRLTFYEDWVSVRRGWDEPYGLEDDAWASIERRVKAALETRRWPELLLRTVEIPGGDARDIERLARTLSPRCAVSHNGGVRIVVGGSGEVIDVTGPGQGPRPDPGLRCIREALRGLRFPCLAGHDVVPDWIIIE